MELALPPYGALIHKTFGGRHSPQPRARALPMPPRLARFFINPRHRVKIERMNGEVRDREKVMRGLQNMHTPILKGM